LARYAGAFAQQALASAVTSTEVFVSNRLLTKTGSQSSHILQIQGFSDCFISVTL
jgi:hypothetical protein